MADTRSELDSLDLVELINRLEESGFDISDTLFARLQPFLVVPYQAQWQLGSLIASVDVIAQQDCHVLAIHDSGNVLVGSITADSQLARGKRYRSLNLACREFIGIVEDRKSVV